MKGTFANARRVVIKVGTGVLTSGIGNLDTERIDCLCRQIAELRDRGIEVILVSSGAVGLGMGRLELNKRPKDLATLQACASIGQSILINNWQRSFDPFKATVAQILLTREDLRARHRHTAVFNTIEQLLSHGVIPIVNENDAISSEEIRFGDNDTLSALVASVVNADFLFILSNIPGLIDMKGTGEVVPVVEKITSEIESMAQGTEHTTSVGGMISKLSAAKIAQRAGCNVVIGSGGDEKLFNKLLAGTSVGTLFQASDRPVRASKRWLAIQDSTHGTIRVDAGAAEAILHHGRSLLAAGIVETEGSFEAGDVVLIADKSELPIAHGIIDLSTAELNELSTSKELAQVVVHRDRLVML